MGRQTFDTEAYEETLSRLVAQTGDNADLMFTMALRILDRLQDGTDDAELSAQVEFICHTVEALYSWLPTTDGPDDDKENDADAVVPTAVAEAALADEPTRC